MTTRPFTRMHSAEDVRITSDRLGSHFFDDETMRYFDSRLTSAFHTVTPYSTPITEGDTEVVYIVTSERFEDDPRQYAVRRVRVWRNEDGRDRITFDRVLVAQLTYSEQPRAREVAKRMASIAAATERDGGVTALNAFLAGVATTTTAIVDTEQVTA